eukprot:CCRYP_018129-RA/>CCRYP_018129-RA protein AED:0.14 eAED:0.24 QI:0/0/0/1/0/0/5/0/312
MLTMAVQQTMHSDNTAANKGKQSHTYGDGQKQAGCVWNSYLVEKICSIGFQPSLLADCVFFCDDVIFIVYVDDGIFLGPNNQKLTDVIHEISAAGLDIENQRHPADYGNGCIEFTQCTLVDVIINDINIGDAYTAKATQQLHAFKDSLRFDECNVNFNYPSVVVELSHSDILQQPSFATYQVAKYSSNPRKEHGEAIVHLVHYLKKTRHLEIKFRPNESKGFECYCNAGFATGTKTMPIRSSLEVDGSYSMQDVLLLGLKTTILSSTLHHQGRVHHHVYGLTGCHSYHGTHEQIPGKKLQGHLYSTPSLQGL